VLLAHGPTKAVIAPRSSPDLDLMPCGAIDLLADATMYLLKQLNSRLRVVTQAADLKKQLPHAHRSRPK
jgi:hypothetical protein